MERQFFTLFLIALAAVSCTTFDYRLSKKIPVSKLPNPKHTFEMELSNTKYSYFWGAFPKKHEIFVDQEFATQWDAKEVSSFKAKDYQRFVDQFISIVSLGIVIPRTYYLRGNGP